MMTGRHRGKVTLSMSSASVDDDAETTSSTVTGTLNVAPFMSVMAVTVSDGASGECGEGGDGLHHLDDLGRRSVKRERSRPRRSRLHERVFSGSYGVVGLRVSLKTEPHGDQPLWRTGVVGRNARGGNPTRRHRKNRSAIRYFSR